MSRDAILGRVRAALTGAGSDSARSEIVAARMAQSGPLLVPQRVARPRAGLVELFKTQLAAQGTDAIEVATSEGVPGALADHLQRLGLPLRVRCGADRRLAGVPWANAPQLALAHGAAVATDAAGLSHAAAGVAETGTLVLDSGADNPVTLAFLPDVHIVVLDETAIVATYEEALARIAETRCGAAAPRTINFVTSASRTADIGGRIVMGAHGPRRLAVILIGDTDATS